MGFSLGEILLLVTVGIIVVGPKRLPGLMRTAGQWVARLRRMTMDLRSQSGIDDLLRAEGLEQHLHELRSLSRINVVETLMTPAAAASARAPVSPPASLPATVPSRLDQLKLRPAAPASREPAREREYPAVGCDAYGALPEDAAIYWPPPEEARPEATADADGEASEGRA